MIVLYHRSAERNMQNTDTTKLHITVHMYIAEGLIVCRVDRLKCCFLTLADESCGIPDFVYLNKIFMFVNWELCNLHF
jgi:hypothetical protein